MSKIHIRTPTAADTIIQIFAFFAESFASAIFPAVTALLILAANTIATIPNGVQHKIVLRIDNYIVLLF